ncbi:MAG: hypothetical protein RIS64_4296 [Bacteroidota bacterium]|jgi:subtilisin family serine protease
MKKAFQFLLFMFCASTAVAQTATPSDSLEIVVIFGNEETLNYWKTLLRANEVAVSEPSGARLWRIAIRSSIVIGGRTIVLEDPATIIGVIGGRADAIGLISASGNTNFTLPHLTPPYLLNSINARENGYPFLTRPITIDRNPFNINDIPFLPTAPIEVQRDLKIYLLDTGIELDNNNTPNHNLLKRHVDMTAAKDFVNNTDFPNDDHEERHGTAVAGIVTRYLSYLNNPSGKSVKITPFKVLNRNGVGTTFNIIKAIDQATKNGANLINCSFAIKKRFLPFYGNAPLQIAIDKAREKGILFITGAGNDDSNIECRPVFPASLPNDNILTVGACQYQNSEQQKASFSNYGKRSVDVFAPGFRIGTTGKENTLVRITGTSFSTPIVTGLAALLAVQMASNAPMNAPSNAPTAPTNDPIDFRLIKKIIMDNADGRLRSESVKGVINCPKALRTL